MDHGEFPLHSMVLVWIFGFPGPPASGRQGARTPHGDVCAAVPNDSCNYSCAELKSSTLLVRCGWACWCRDCGDSSAVCPPHNPGTGTTLILLGDISCLQTASA